ncbi:MAG: hypothetical protein JXR10_02775 [Cyclobacteriaceae bacterium]
MRYLNIIITIILLNSCGNQNAQNTIEETPIDTVILEPAIQAEPKIQAAKESKTLIEEEPLTFDSTGRPSQPVFRNLQIDTSKLFGVWTIDASFPNADFLIDKDKYYIADFDGDPYIPYILEGDSLTLFFEWGKETSRISLPTSDLLMMLNKNGLTTRYERFKN